MAPHTIRLTTPWEAVSLKTESQLNSGERLSLPICVGSGELTSVGNFTAKLVRRFHAPPAIAETARIFLRIVLDGGHFLGVLNGTELSESTSGDSVIRQLQSGAVQEIRPSVLEITSIIRAYNQLSLLIGGPVEDREGVVPGKEMRLLWVSLEIVESEEV
jgi:hypothetical protein